MALGARRRGHSDIGVGITGVAGPDSDDRGNPVGTVYIAAAFGKQLYVRKLELKNGNTSRDKIRHLACMHALDLVRRLALGLHLSAYTSYKIASYTRGDRAVRALDGVRVLAFYLALCVFIGSLTLVGQYQMCIRDRTSGGVVVRRKASAVGPAGEKPILQRFFCSRNTVSA